MISHRLILLFGHDFLDNDGADNTNGDILLRYFKRPALSAVHGLTPRIKRVWKIILAGAISKCVTVCVEPTVAFVTRTLSVDRCTFSIGRGLYGHWSLDIDN